MKYFEDTNSDLYRDAVAAGYQYEEKNDGEGGSYMKLVGIAPPKTDYAPPRQRSIKQVGPPPKEEEKKKPLEEQPQKLPDPVVKGREDTKSFESLYGNSWKRPEGHSSNALTDAAKMPENAWTSRKDSDNKYKQAKEKAQSFNGASLGDYYNITGKDVTARVMKQNQQMTADFQNNWKDYLNPSLPKRPSLQGY